MSIVNLKLRPYQEDAKREILDAWEKGYQNVALVLPTGAGKTVLFSDIISEHKGPSIAVAHRQELVSQISVTLASYKLNHGIIGPPNVIANVNSLQVMEHGQSYYDPNALCRVAGVDTLIRRTEAIKSWANRVTLWVQDETHHVLCKNKWGKAAAMFPQAKGLGVTATPERADGQGIGRKAAGLMDALIIGPTMRELISQGYLTDYRIFAPPSDLDLGGVTVSKSTGDYGPKSLKIAVRKSHVIGNVVSHYQKIASGKLGVTFASDVETAGDIAKSFNVAGVPAEVVSAKTSDHVRAHILRRFRNREILQLVNVDLFGEGFDLPAIEVVSMARPTQSYGLYVQQFGRALRPMEGKGSAIIIDHAGNVMRHGLPDVEREWSLDSRDKRASKPVDAIPVRVCPACMMVFERFNKTCPHCGHYPAPSNRSRPEFVDGDLTELDASALEAMRDAATAALIKPSERRAELERKGAPPLGVAAGGKRQAELIESQGVLRDRIALWAGYQENQGRSQSESYRRFYHLLGIDVLGAQALNLKETGQLIVKIEAALMEERKSYNG